MLRDQNIFNPFKNEHIKYMLYPIHVLYAAKPLVYAFSLFG